MSTSPTVLRIDSGADHPNSVSRHLADELTDRLIGTGATIVRRDLTTQELPVVDGAWVAAAFGGVDNGALATSDALVDELLAADELIIVAPVYNFGIPAALKLWIDQVTRAGRTFRYGESGPVGLVTASRAWIVTASGGTELYGPADFAADYLRFVLGFLGIADVRLIGADSHMQKGETAIAAARQAITDAFVAS
jgi:FMN-dependent NADH-azoreductase